MQTNYSNYVLGSVKSLAKTRKIEISHDHKFAKIICPNPSHKAGKEQTPSLRINIEERSTSKRKYKSGSAKCYSCGVYYSNWNKVLLAINRPDLVDHKNSASSKDDESILSFFSSDTDNIVIGNEEKSPLQTDLKDSMSWDKNSAWRGINGQLVYDIGGRLYFDSQEQAQTTMLYLPCNVLNVEVGGIRCNIEKRGKLNYFNTPGPWTFERGLFPFDYVVSQFINKKTSTIVLVEGPRDALNFIQNGIPALAILGSNNWCETKSDILTSLPIDKIITCFDMDEAGDKAKSKVYSTLRSQITVSNFNLSKWHTKLGWKSKDKLDPGNSPIEVCEALKKHIT